MDSGGSFAMSNPFLKLREARETKGISIEEAAELTHIDPEYLEALEKGDFDKLPDPMYVRGFIRTYARQLGVDSLPLIRHYKEIEKEFQPPQSGETDSQEQAFSRSRAATLREREKRGAKKHLQWKKWVPTSLTKRQRVVILAAAAGVVLVSGLAYWLLSDDSSSAESAQPKTNAEAEKVSDSQNGTGSFAAEDRPVVTLLKSSESSKYGDYYGVQKVEQVKVTIKANESTYIRVRGGGPQGEVLADEQLAQGKTKTFTHDDWLSVRIDHPDLVELSVNGVKIETSELKEVSLFQFKKDDGSGLEGIQLELEGEQ